MKHRNPVARSGLLALSQSLHLPPVRVVKSPPGSLAAGGVVSTPAGEGCLRLVAAFTASACLRRNGTANRG